MLPGPYPKTPEERAATAKKYNMQVEDYEPYPDDGMGYGDYPKLPDRSQQERDPWYDWDHPDLRLNWGEPVREPCPICPFFLFRMSSVDQMALFCPGGLSCGSVVKNLLATAGDIGLIPDPGKSPEEGHGIPLQHSCWENPMDSPWVTKSRT